MADGGNCSLAAITGRFSSLERFDRLLIEDLAHQPETLVQVQLQTIGGGDAGGLLAPMLQRVQPQVGEAANRLTRRKDPDHSALFARTVRLVAGGDGEQPPTRGRREPARRQS